MGHEDKDKQDDSRAWDVAMDTGQQVTNVNNNRCI